MLRRALGSSATVAAAYAAWSTTSSRCHSSKAREEGGVPPSGGVRQVLTSVALNLHVNHWRVEAASSGLASDQPWSVEKRTLHGGRQEGVDVIEVDNGRLRFTAPTPPLVLLSSSQSMCSGRQLGAALRARSPSEPEAPPSPRPLRARGPSEPEAHAPKRAPAARGRRRKVGAVVGSGRFLPAVPAQSLRSGRCTGASPMAIGADCILSPHSPACLPTMVPTRPLYRAPPRAQRGARRAIQHGRVPARAA